MVILGCIHLWCISWNNAIYISMDIQVESRMDMGILIGGYNIGESNVRVKLLQPLVVVILGYIYSPVHRRKGKWFYQVKYLKCGDDRDRYWRLSHYLINYLIKGDHMNGKDILLYTLCAAGTLYALWIIINIVWFGILSLYHRIADEIAFYQWKNRKWNGV